MCSFEDFIDSEARFGFVWLNSQGSHQRLFRDEHAKYLQAPPPFTVPRSAHRRHLSPACPAVPDQKTRVGHRDSVREPNSLGSQPLRQGLYDILYGHCRKTNRSLHVFLSEIGWTVLDRFGWETYLAIRHIIYTPYVAVFIQFWGSIVAMVAPISHDLLVRNREHHLYTPCMMLQPHSLLQCRAPAPDIPIYVSTGTFACSVRG